MKELKKVNNFMNESIDKWNKETKYQIPIGVIEKEGRKNYPYEGVELALLLYWSAKRGLLDKKISNAFKFLADNVKVLSHEKLINMYKETILDVLIPDYFNDESKEFIIDYAQIIPNWKENYWHDLRDKYPNYSSYSMMPENDEEYNYWLDLLDQRFEEYNLEKKEKNINK